MSKATENIRYYSNPNGPVIGAVNRNIIEKDGLFFKDLDNSGQFKPFDDWRLPAAERAAAFAEVLTLEEKLGQLFVSDWRMGKDSGTLTPMQKHMGMQQPERKVDETGLLDEAEIRAKTIFGEQILPGTTVLLKEWWARHLILRANPSVREMTDWLNQLHSVAEECERFVPVQVLSNSRNENGEVIYGMNDAAGVFATWPGTMGIAAAIKGDSIQIADDFADAVRREWDAVGLKKGYMYMADTMTDPRWQRTYGTFGEDPKLISEIFDHIIPRIQGSRDGVTTDGVAMTVKHFPGGGARENGFDPHYAMGQWNVYPTEGSLQKYHLPPFQTAVDNHASSIMPYYAKPAAEKSAPQSDCSGNPMEMKPYGFAYNKAFITELLRNQMGFTGYINSDTGIVHNMCWGVEMLDAPERIAFAVNNGGVDLISGQFDIVHGKEALARAANDYYDSHPIPEGFTKEQITLTEDALTRAVTRTLTELFALGMFENPYRDPDAAETVVANETDWANAADAHRKSVVLLKNDGVLPLQPGKVIYAEAFTKNPDAAPAATAALREMLKDYPLTDDPAQADVALLMLTPSSGAYFNATPGYLELDICEGKTVCDVDQQGRPTGTTHIETTLSGANRIAEIARMMHNRGGKVVANINFTLAWQLGNVEPFCDALTAGFDTYPSATLDVMCGRFAPVGKLPITLPRGDEVLAVNADGVCISPNDVPGYAKDAHMPEHLKDENGKAYAYRDAAGNYYELNFGLRCARRSPVGA